MGVMGGEDTDTLGNILYRSSEINFFFSRLGSSFIVKDNRLNRKLD